MMDKDLSSVLKSQAVSLGLCKEWTEGWGYPGQQELIDKFLHGIDFCIKHNWPGVDFIKKNFDKGLLHRNGVFTDEPVHVKDLNGQLVLNGKCEGMVLAGGMTVCDVYVRHECEITLDCKGLSKVFVNVYDRAKVHVTQRDGASVYVYAHGDECKIYTNGCVMQRKTDI